MDVEEFKKRKPEYKDIEGDQLWDAMTYDMLRQQQGSEIINQAMPIWKTHTLRWLHYRRTPNWTIGKPSTDKYISDKRCKACKWGVNLRVSWIIIAEDGTRSSCSYCPHCNKEYHEEPNTNFTHKLYKAAKWISKIFWIILDKLHLVRSTTSGRYEMFGDEQRYVESWQMNFETGETSKKFKKRKWWEYILIEKP